MYNLIVDKNILFIKTLEDIQSRLASHDSYEILMIAGLLRKLLLDDYPLIDQVNEKKRIKVRFTINGRQINPLLKEASFWSIQDGFDPETAHFAVFKGVDRNSMLKEIVMRSNGVSFTVADLIKFLCHVEGSVHSGIPKEDKEFILQEIEKELKIGGLNPVIRSIMSIARVVLKGLEPLRKEIKK